MVFDYSKYYNQILELDSEGRRARIQPGVIWVGNYFQVGVEALVPINRASGSGVGVVAQLHLYLDDMFPKTIGRPLFGQSTPARPVFGN